VARAVEVVTPAVVVTPGVVVEAEAEAASSRAVAAARTPVAPPIPGVRLLYDTIVRMDDATT
jgi:hypothetical protein